MSILFALNNGDKTGMFNLVENFYPDHLFDRHGGYHTASARAVAKFIIYDGKPVQSIGGSAAPGVRLISLAAGTRTPPHQRNASPELTTYNKNKTISIITKYL